MELTEEKKTWLESLKLGHGTHGTPDKGACVMEAVAYVAGEPFSDHPKCASRVITRFCVRLNDRWSDEERQALKPFVLRIAGTAAALPIEIKRAFMCADWSVRELLPMLLDAAKFPEWAEKLRALPEIVDAPTANAGRDLARLARAEARNKWDAAAYAAAAAAADAAADAYADAYADAAAYAAAAAAADAAADAYADAYADAAADAYADAYADAAADALRTKAHASALGLLERLIAVTEKLA